MGHQKIYNGIKVTVAADYEEMSMLAAGILLDKACAQPGMTLLVPTGTTPLGTYKIIRERNPDAFKSVTFFNMDEYCVDADQETTLIPDTHPAGYRYYMKKNLFDRLTPKASYFPGMENMKNPGHYDDFIRRTGGIDFCLNAMGEDGHTFGFNMPGTPFHSRTRLVDLGDRVRDVNRRLTGLATPTHAVTIGLLTGMESKEILFLVSGKRKADILYRTVRAPRPETDIPATILKNHANCQWIIDRDAESKLREHDI